MVVLFHFMHACRDSLKPPVGYQLGENDQWSKVSNFEQAVGVSIDGSGDFTTTSNSICSNGTIRMKDRIFYPHSLGILYTAISNFLGCCSNPA